MSAKDQNEKNEEEREHSQEPREVEREEKLDECDLPFSCSDMKLIVESRALHVNKAFLCKLSPVFKQMFGDGQKHEFQLEGVTFEDMTTFLKCSFPHVGHRVTGNNVLAMLKLSQRFQTSLKEECENFITDVIQSSKPMTVETLLEYLYACEKYSLTKALNECITRASGLLSETLSTKTMFHKLTLQTRYEISNARLKRFEEIQTTLKNYYSERTYEQSSFDHLVENPKTSI